MDDRRARRNRLKLLISAITLSCVLVIAAVAERNQRTGKPVSARNDSGERSRAVFGGPAAKSGSTDPSPVAPAPPGEAEQQNTPVPTQDEGKDQMPASILGFLERWRSTLASGNLAAHGETYALKVDRFFRQKNVSRSAVVREKERMLRTYPSMNKYELHNVKLESMRGDRAVVTFRKDWDASGSRRFAGSEQQRLTLRRAGDSWQITGEEELKVYWVHR